MRFPSFVVLAALSLSACARNIPNTEILDTPDNRSVIALVDAYRKAFDTRNTDAVMALVSPAYYDDSGTVDPERRRGLQGAPRGPPRHLLAHLPGPHRVRDHRHHRERRQGQGRSLLRRQVPGHDAAHRDPQARHRHPAARSCSGMARTGRSSPACGAPPAGRDHLPAVLLALQGCVESARCRRPPAAGPRRLRPSPPGRAPRPPRPPPGLPRPAPAPPRAARRSRSRAGPGT